MFSYLKSIAAYAANSIFIKVFNQSQVYVKLVIVFFILVSDDDTYTRITVCVRSAMCRVTGVMLMN